MTTYTKLQHGEWGVMSSEQLKPQTPVTVTKRDGTKKTEIVGSILLATPGRTLATIANNTTASGAIKNRGLLK